MIETIKNDSLQITVKSLGAEMISLKSLPDEKEFLWQGDSRYWSGQSTVLFPIIGGLPDDKYSLDGRIYEMMPHGFARISDFELVKKTQSELCFRLLSSNQTLERFPYRYEFFVTYRLERNTLHHALQVNNVDEKTMLFSVGAHPGFNCPLYDNEKMEDYWLLFEKEEQLQRRIKKDGLLSGEREEFLNGQREAPLSHRLFYNGAVILNDLQSEWLEIRNKVNSRVIRVNFKGFPYLGIWSAHNDAPFVCIEPWYGVDSTAGDPYDFEKKEGLQRLSPGQSFACEYTITIE